MDGLRYPQAVRCYPCAFGDLNRLTPAMRPTGASSNIKFASPEDSGMVVDEQKPPPVGSGVEVGDGVTMVTVRVGEGVWVAVGGTVVGVEVFVGTPVTVGVGVDVRMAVGVAVGVDVTVGVRVGLGV